MRTLVVSDLHLGSRGGVDVLRGPGAQALHGALGGVDRLVLLGDVLELRHGPVAPALEAALPVLRELGDAFAGGEVVIVPGNHDHALMSALAARAALAPRREPLGLERRFSAAQASPVAEALAGALGAERTSLAYPGLWLRTDVYATHGHYLDCHSTLPTFERLAAGAMARLLGGLEPGAGVPDDYERLLEPIYAWIGAVAMRAPDGGRAPHGSSARTWRMLAGDGRRPIRARALASLFPAGVGLLNRAGIGPLRADLSRDHLRRAGYEAMAAVVQRLGIEARHVIFGHSHRAGPLADDDLARWSTSHGVALHNSGNWVFEPGMLARNPASPFWPGTAIAVDADGPPVLLRLLGERARWA